ncbi:hypothetical protein KRX19_05500 [Cardiobacteriaceae bacterium TAE3-ERU3]|nr:hypothetical protein [Cardiobacteriaceae bacterium TAE3-ERU3]
MKKILLVVGFLVMAGCNSVPPLNFNPNEEDIQVEKTQRLDASLKTITVSTAKRDEQLGKIDVGIAGNVNDGSLKGEFKSALEEASIRSRLFSDMSDRGVSIFAKIMKLQTPQFGSNNFPTDVIVRYEIMDRTTDEIIYDQQIKSHGEVPFGYSMIGGRRYIEARNIAMRRNIVNFINDLKSRGLKPSAKQAQ